MTRPDPEGWMALDPTIVARLLEAMPLGIALFDAEGAIVVANPAAERALRLAPGTARGVSLRDPSWRVTRLDGEPVGVDDRPVRKVLGTGKAVPPSEIVIQRPDGERLLLRIDAQPLGPAGSGGAVAFIEDISGRLELERSLREKSASFRLLFEQHPLPMWLVDLDTLEYLDVNRAAVQAYGYTQDEFLQLRASDIRPLEDVPHLIKAVKQVGPGWMNRGVWRHRTKDGRLLRVEIHTCAVDHPSRNTVLAEARDVAAQRREEAMLHEQQEQLRTIIANAPVTVFSIDRRGIIQTYMGRGEDPTGYDSSALVGESIFEVYRESPNLLHNVNRALAGELVSDIVEVQGGPDVGRFFDVRYMPHFGPDGAIVGVFGIATDVTEGKRDDAERARLLLREREARAEAEETNWRATFLAESSRILASSLDHRTTLASIGRLALPHLADWCIVDLQEPDRSIHRVAIAHVEPTLSERAQHLLRVYPPSTPGTEGVRRVLASSQSKVYALTKDISLLSLGAGDEEARILMELGVGSAMIVPLVARWRTLGAISLIWVRPDRHYGSRELQLAEDLAQRCALAVDNARLYREAHDAIRARDEFLSIASHELRAPLTSLLLQIQFLLDSVRDGSAPTGADVTSMLERAEQHTQRLSRLMSSLLDVTRIGARKLDLECEQVPLAQVVRDVVARLEAQIERSGCTLTLDVEEDLVGLWDRLRVEQMVTNLLTNALKYGRQQPVAIEAHRDGDQAVLAVRDHGVGIPPAQRTHVFDMFHRAAPDRSFEGLGIGLYIVRQVASALGGSVDVECPADGGSRFVLSLPALPRDHTPGS